MKFGLAMAEFTYPGGVGLEYSIMALVCGFRGLAVSSDHAAIWYSLVIPCGIARLRT